MATVQGTDLPGDHHPAFARFTALAAAIVGVFVLAGWWFDVDSLVNILPHWPRMSPAAAVTFIVAGAALWLASMRKARATIVLALVLLVFGFVELARVSGVLGPDVDALAAALSTPDTPAVPYMPAATALGFALLGLSLVCAAPKRTALLHQGLALACLLVAWVGLSRFMFGGEVLFDFADMAAHTAILFLLLSTGALTLRSESGVAALLVSDGVGGIMARRLLPAAVVVPLLAGALTVHYERGGILGFETAVSIFALSSVIAIVAFVWIYAARADRTDRLRRDAERALRRSEEHNQLIVETSLDAVITMDRAGCVTGWNGQAERVFGWPRNEVLGRDLAELVIPEEYREAHRAGLRRYVEGGMSRVLNRRIEMTAKHRDGREFPVELAVTPIGFGEDLAFSAFIRDITTRVRAEAALRESEQRFRSTANSAPALMWMSGPDKRVTWFNQRWLDFVGRSLEQELGDGWCDNLHPADFDRKLDTYQAAFDARRPYEIEYRLQREDGAWRWLMERATPNFGPNGDFEGYLGTCIDITEQRETVEALRESRSRFKTLTESLPQMIWTCTRDGQTDYLSRQWLDYTGRGEAQQLGVGWLEQVHPDDRLRVQSEWARVVANGDIYDLSFRIRRYDGVYRWFKTRAVTLRDPAGRILKWFGSNTDIEDSVAASARLNVQLERMQLLDRTTQAIGMHQEPGAVYEVVLRSLEQDLGVEFCCICHYQANPEVLTVARVGDRCRALARETGFDENTRVEIAGTSLTRCVRGELVYESGAEGAPVPKCTLTDSGLRALVGAPLAIEDEVFGVLIVGKRASESFSEDDREFLRQLSRHVALASHQARLYAALQLAYQDLRQTQQTVMQQERLRALGQIATGVAHDINNALSPAALYTQSLLKHETTLSARARENLAVIQRAIEDVAATVQRMRAFYLPSGHEPTLAPVDVNQTLEQVIELTRARWSNMPQERGVVVKVEKHLAKDLPKILGAEGEIRDALTNLILNAVDALPEGGTVSLRTRFDPQGSHVIVEVQDDGIGMSETTRLRCLEPFFTTKSELGGTGLGLPMVFGMAQRHGGDLEIDSEPGRGTTMRLVFPQAPTGLDSRDRELSRPSRSLRLLLVDDDPMLLRSLRDALQLDEHEVLTAEGGQAGVDLFAAQKAAGQRVDAVFTDLGMPHVDGRKVAERIHQMDPAVPIIMLTGWGHRLLATADKPAHVDLVLAKPPKMADLRSALAELVRPPGDDA